MLRLLYKTRSASLYRDAVVLRLLMTNPSRPRWVHLIAQEVACMQAKTGKG